MTTITTKIIAGDYPQAVRQKTTTGLTGVAPVGPLPHSHLYKPILYTGGRYDYVDPANTTLNTLADGGLFDFENEDLPVAVTEVRGITTAYNIYIQDKDGSNTITLATAVTGGTRKEFHPAVVVLPSQRLKITAAGAITVDVYVVKGNCRTA
jgi:hypothetical protein